MAATDENIISLQPGTVIAGRYEVVKCLGAGSMGLVYACRHRELAGHLVAVKVLFPEVAQDNVAAARFRNEIVASYGVSHANVVRAYEYFRDGDLVAYTMEYVSGGDLADKLSQGQRLPISEVVRFLSQISSGVQAIHDAGIVHRDLKPENILLTTNGDVKITDFGIARTGHGPKLTEHGGVVGTIDYVSPEYLERGQVDTRSDIYALGVLGYEMLTGESPFKGDSVIATMTMRLRSDPKPPSQMCPECPPELDRIILKALERNPEQRYQAAIEIFYDLQELIPASERLGSSGAHGRPVAAQQQPAAAVKPAAPAQPAVSLYVQSDAETSTAQPLAVSSRPSGFASSRGGAASAATQMGPSALAALQNALPADESDTMRQPLRLESVLSYADLVSRGAQGNGPTQIQPVANRLPGVSVAEGGIDRMRLRTLSQSLGEVQRSGWVVDFVLVAVAAIIGVGVGVAGLFLWKPELFERKSTLGQEYDIRIFDNDYRP